MTFTASVLQTIHYLSRKKVVNTEVRELCRVSRGKVRPASTDRWKDEQLVVPPLPPSNLRGCHLIAIQYDVMVSWSIYLRFAATTAITEVLVPQPDALPHSPPVLLSCEPLQSLVVLSGELLQ